MNIVDRVAEIIYGGTDISVADAQQLARKVITVMHTPSEAMLRAGNAARLVSDAVGIWAAMIGTALEENKP